MSPQTILRGQRCRFYPSAGQRILIERCFDQVRMVYNQGLHQLETAYASGTKLTVNDLSRAFTEFRRAHPHHQGVPSTVATQALRHLQSAFTRFFAACRDGRGALAYPTPKGKFWAPSCSLQIDPRLASNHTLWAQGKLQVPGFGACKLRGLREGGSLPKTIAICRDGTGRYWISFNHEVQVHSLKVEHAAVGIDLGVKHLATLSTGEKIDNPKPMQRALKQLQREQRALSRSQKGSRRREKRRRRVARLHLRVANQRRDFLQKTTTGLIRRFGVIAVEDLNVRGMVRNRRLARHISDSGMSEFVRLLKYKATWYGRSVESCGRWDPTTQTCSACGGRPSRRLSLSVREWECEHCGARHDRDINAAINVLAFASAKAPGIGRCVEGADHREVCGHPVKRVPLSGFQDVAATMAVAV